MSLVVLGTYQFTGIDWTGLWYPLLLLGNGSVKIIPRQRRIVGGIVFHTIRGV
jgi:hypothetical protein